QFRAQVMEVSPEAVVVDLNHPMAGQNLHFDIEILEVREATADEIAHGHAHGVDGLQEIIPFFATILITQFTIDCLKAFYADKLRHRIEEKTMGRINKVAGVFIIIFALRLMYEVVFTHSSFIH